MAVAAKDDNDASTLIGVSSVDGTPTRARVDPVTGYVLMQIQVAPFATTTQLPKIDDNDVPVLMGVTNDVSQTISPLISDPNYPGYVLADVVLI